MPEPLLIPDRYYLNKEPNWSKLGASLRFNGAILKATDGTSFPPSEKWFVENWPAVQKAGGNRYGRDFFRGAYHYLEFFDDGAEQASHYLSTIEKAGGWQSGDFWPIVDVERGKEKSANHAADAKRIQSCVRDFARVIRKEMGAKTRLVLYAGRVIRDLDVTLSDVCDYLWTASYTRSLKSLDEFGWPDNKVLLWQYTDGKRDYTQYPSSADGLGATDLSVFRGASLDALRGTLVQGA